jgi:ribosome recycling factor
MIDETLFEAEEKMEKAVDVAKDDFAGIRTGRAHPGFQTPEARTIIISPFDKGSMHAIEKAIQQADLGVNPSNDGNIIRCVMPHLTEERRREYVKMAHHQAEEARVSIRNIRRHAKTELERLIKDGEVGEDEGMRAEKELESVTKRHVDQVDDLLKHKEAELLEV